MKRNATRLIVVFTPFHHDFDRIVPKVQVKVRRSPSSAAYTWRLDPGVAGMVGMYASVMFGVIHIVFFRDRNAWTIDTIDRAL